MKYTLTFYALGILGALIVAVVVPGEVGLICGGIVVCLAIILGLFSYFMKYMKGGM